jgi:catechol 2,3-dioxygenase-like lactoylglutathione lyase family enzyme
MDIRVTSTVFQIFAHDLQRSLEFYRLLGLSVPEPEGPPHVAVDLPGGNTLSFDTDETIAGMHPGWAPSNADSRLALAFGVASPEDVDALFEQVTGAGYQGPLKPYDAPWGQRYATVADPDGNWVDLFAPLKS